MEFAGLRRMPVSLFDRETSRSWLSPQARGPRSTRTPLTDCSGSRLLKILSACVYDS
jgi:hypothetical protein